jgi:CheY-like chemotaxis protein
MRDKNEKTLLIVDDLETVRDFYRDVAEEQGWTVTEAYDAASFKDAMTRTHDAIVLDLAMPSMTGIEVLELLAEAKTASSILIASGQDMQFLQMSMRMGRGLGLAMVASLSKPIRLVQFERALKKLESHMKLAA